MSAAVVCVDEIRRMTRLALNMNASIVVGLQPGIEYGSFSSLSSNAYLNVEWCAALLQVLIKRVKETPVCKAAAVGHTELRRYFVSLLSIWGK